MDAIDAILTRRSIRKYRSENILELIEESLKAAMNAPSANSQLAFYTY
jgi:nitroreductase